MIRMDPEEKRIAQAGEAEKEEIRQYVHDPSPRVLRSLLANSNLDEKDVVIIANRKNLSEDILESIARDKRWDQSYPVRLAIAKNPRSPLTITLSIARFLRIFDLEEITRNHFIPLVFRHKVEAMINERIPTMPPGNKKTLAKKAAGSVLLKLLQERLPEVVRLCLDNPNMVERHLYKVISRTDTALDTIVMIANHPVWSRRPLVRFALARNPQTPLSLSANFLKTMKLVDLRELFVDPSLPVTIKPFVYRELQKRGSDPETSGEEPVFEINEEELRELEEELHQEPDLQQWNDEHEEDGPGEQADRARET